MAGKYTTMQVETSVLETMRKYKEQTGVSIQFLIKAAVSEYIAKNPPKE